MSGRRQKTMMSQRPAADTSKAASPPIVRLRVFFFSSFFFNFSFSRLVRPLLTRAFETAHARNLRGHVFTMELTTKNTRGNCGAS